MDVVLIYQERIFNFFTSKTIILQVKWSGPGIRKDLPMQATDMAGRLEIRGFTPQLAGLYTCTAVGYEQFDEAQVSTYNYPRLWYNW